jgi:biotin synthase-related radical SAM superfamily protein
MDEMISTSSAGPSAGQKSIFLRFGKTRVRLGVGDDAELKLVGNSVLFKGEEIVKAEVEKVGAHCPEQAYITVSKSCVMGCKFCLLPRMRPQRRTIPEIIDIIERANSSIKAISFTSGVLRLPEEEIENMCDVIKAVTNYGLPIGVSVYPIEGCSIKLKKAGASEVKYDVQTMNKKIYRMMCPKSSLEERVEGLSEGVEVFGRGNVSSNIIIGLGEKDEEVICWIEELCEIGVIPILRTLEGEVAKGKRPSPERLIYLASELKDALSRHNLDPTKAKTMCLACGGCDLVPFLDL